jgi:hypothetical protein
MWRDAGFLQVERRAPESISSGKILHVRAAPRPMGVRPKNGI